MSKPGTTCPICAKEVGVWSIIKAPLPNLIRCEHCNGALVYEKNSWSLVIFSVVLYLIMVGGMLTIAYLNLETIALGKFAITWAISSVLYWIIGEFSITAYLRSKEKLIAKKDKISPSKSDPL
ncbi:MAG: hypothetical protein OEV64_01565 [Desulfobulbaceae bacterium]|nr:hypothetical protein [Desulfobulbaceae bacterium]